MGYLAWTAATGGLLLLMSLSQGWISRAPVPIFGLYLLVGILCGPWVWGILELDVLNHAALISRITEMSMAASLFITGLKMRHLFSSPVWKMGVRLALPAMLLTIAGIMILAHYLIGLSWPLSLALAAIIAPTDPVLASLVAINDASDDDQLRLSLSCEAGLNDGTALPFLMLALIWHIQGEAMTFESLWHWFTIDLIWALLAGLMIGYLLGRLIGLVAAHSRHAQREVAPSDFVALSLICLSFALALSVSASGFLAAFAAGVGLRSAEMSVQKKHPNPPLSDREPTDDEPVDKQQHHDSLPAEMQVNPHTRHTMTDKSRITSMGLVIGDALSFGDTVERLLAAALVIALGVTLSEHWNTLALVMALVAFCLIRPVAVVIATWRAGLSWPQRTSLGWLGIRGIGSLNYIAYAYVHGMQGANADLMINVALTMITVSVLVHGITVTPLLSWHRNA